MRALKAISAATVVLFALSCAAASAEDAVVWNMGETGRFDPTNKSYEIVDGRVTVDLRSEGTRCPTGLGHLASGMDTVREIVIVFKARETSDAWLHVTWNAGGSGTEQFDVRVGEKKAGESCLVDAAAENGDIAEKFRVSLAKGDNELALVFLSGDGLRFRNLVLSGSDILPGEQRPSEAVHALKPGYAFPTLGSYSKELGEEGILLDSDHVFMYAPKRLESEAREIFKYLVKAYDELHDIVGVHTKCKIAVHHFPEGHPYGFGGTTDYEIHYSTESLMLSQQKEWTSYRVPHMCGYIEEMAHNFVGETGMRFGWEMPGWSVGAKVTEKVAPNGFFTRYLMDTRQEQIETWTRYKRLGNTFPPDIEYNVVDRIHGYFLMECEKEYGEDFWKDLFREVAKEREALSAAESLGNSTAVRNEQYRITVECMDRMEGLDIKKWLRENGISTTVDIKHLAKDPNWNRKLE